LKSNQLNSVHARYLQGEATFDEIYEATRQHQEVNRKRIVRYGGDADDALMIFHNVILEMVKPDKPPANFDYALSCRLKSRSIDFLRKRTKTLSREVSLESLGQEDEDGTLIPYDIPDERTEVQRKEADQLELTDFLVKQDPGKVDTTTTLIVEVFPKFTSITALAKALGLHHEVVKRKLIRLSRNYDANRFGDYREYLAV